MSTAARMRLAELTTLRVGGPARDVVEARSAAELVDAVRRADAAHDPVLLLAGGSNVLIADEGWDGTVVLVRSRGVEVVGAPAGTGAGAAVVRVAAGEPWDDLVALTVAQGWAGMEALSGIPGSTGATPVQNVGAYGQDVSQTITEVRVWDRVEGRERRLSGPECDFAYRDSGFKRTSRSGPAGGERFLVLEVTFRLDPGPARPIAYAELARRLGVEVGAQPEAGAVRAAVLELRRAKGMVTDVDDPDTWSVGSFFTNPVVSEAAVALPPDAPRWPAGEGLVKVAAAWLIEQAGIPRGYGLPGPAAVSTRHTLALTNRGGATAADVVALARRVRGAVEARFGIVLEAEPRLVGVSL